MHLRVGLGVVLSIFMCTFAGAARAQDAGAGVVGGPEAPPPQIDVVLKRGGTVRGSVISVDPTKDVVIALAGTSVRTSIPWAEIERVSPVVAAGAVPPKASAVAKAQAAPVAGEPGHPLVKIHADAPEAELYVIDGGSGADDHAWAKGGTLVCTAPCDQAINASYPRTFFVSGEHISRSRVFTMSDSGNNVTLHVDTGARSARTPGIVLIAVGGGGLLTGVGIVLVGVAANASPPVVVGVARDRVALSKPSGSAAIDVGGAIAGVMGAMMLSGFITLGASVTSLEGHDEHGKAISRISHPPGPTLGVTF